eukprot:251727_1
MLKQLITTIIIIQNTINIPPNRAAKNALSVIGTETLCTETLICFMILLFITLFHTCQQYCSFIDRQETYVFKFLTLFTILSCLVCSSLDIVHITIHFIECSFFQSKLESIIAGFADIAYFIGSIIKIWFVFKGTIYEISLCTLTVLGFLVSVIIFFAVWHCNDTAFQQHKSDYNPKERPATDALSAADLVLNVVLFSLFWYKLRQTIVCVQIDQSVNQNYNPSNRLLEIISKHSILFGVAMITNQCFYIGIILEEYFRIDKINYTEAILILFSARALENLVNALVLWLMLAINLKLYFKLCGICHTKMQNCCKICISSKIMFGANVHSNIFTEKSVNSTVRTDVETKIKLLHPIDER